MRKGNQRIAQGLLVFALTSLMTSAQAAMVTVTNVVDGNSSSTLFDPSFGPPTGISQSGPSDEVISIGLDTFTATVTGLSPLFATALDTLFMTITAPAGYFISLITYTESGTGTTSDGFASATGSMVIDGIPVNFLTQNFGPVTSSGWTILPTPTPIANKTSINISITNSLVAFAFKGPNNPAATISKTGATITVGLTAIPLPPALWMMGAAVAALVTVGRRRSA